MVTTIANYGHVTSRLNGVRRGAKWWRAFCPSHQNGEKHTSRTLALTVGANGWLEMVCHAGCSREQVIGALGLKPSDFGPPRDDRDLEQRKRDRFKARHAQKHRSKNQRTNRRNDMAGVETGRWDYHDAQGKPLFRVFRFDDPDSGEKSYRQARYVGEVNCEYKWGLDGVTPVLYRLPELLGADPERVVLVVEGEKCVEALRKLGIVATTCPMGAGKWRDEFSECLAGRDVVVIGDNDPVNPHTGRQPGQEHAAQAGVSIAKHANSVKVIEALPGVPDKGDIVEWLAQGGDKKKLWELIQQTPYLKQPLGTLGNTPGNQPSSAPQAEAKADPKREPAEPAATANPAPAESGRPFDPRQGMKQVAAAIFGRADYLSPAEWCVFSMGELRKYESRLSQELAANKQN